MVHTGEGGQARPRCAQLLPGGLWRIEWVGGGVAFYRRDPREHLRLGYDPKHLRVVGSVLRRAQ